MSDFNPFARMQELSQQNSGNRSNMQFFNIKAGERTTLRFLNGLTTYVIVQHKACGAQPVEIEKAAWDEAIAAGQPLTCPSCGQPLAASDILYERPALILAAVHSYIPDPTSGRPMEFVCLSNPDNAKQGLVPTDDAGNPLYTCPIDNAPCNKNERGSQKRAGERGFALAIERECQMDQMGNITRVADKMVTEDDGTTHPRIVLVEQGYKNFWSKLYAALSRWGFAKSICSYDWDVQRLGAGTATDYNLMMLTGVDAPSYVDMNQYAKWMPDLKRFVSAKGSPSYYASHGYPVPGYVAPQKQPSTAPLQPGPYVVPNHQFVVPVDAHGTQYSPDSTYSTGVAPHPPVDPVTGAPVVTATAQPVAQQINASNAIPWDNFQPRQ